MMRTPRASSVAVRRPDGSLAVQVRLVKRLAERYPILAAPGLRGIAVLIETISDGIAALNFAASQVLPEEQARSHTSRLGLVFSLALSMAFGYFLFAVAPHAATVALGHLFEAESLASGRDLLFHVVDGFVKVLFFLAFLWAIAHMKDIRRVFQYHGAEHQAVHAYEAGLNLYPKNLSRFPTEHARCGTAFLIMVIVVSILVFAIVFPFMPDLSASKWLNQTIYVALKAPLIFPIASLSYELIRLSARATNRTLAALLSAPGLLFQKITTKRPQPDQQEVAIVALLSALRPERFIQSPQEAEIVQYFPSFDAFMRTLPAERP